MNTPARDGLKVPKQYQINLCYQVLRTEARAQVGPPIRPELPVQASRAARVERSQGRKYRTLFRHAMFNTTGIVPENDRFEENKPEVDWDQCDLGWDRTPAVLDT